MAFFGKKKDENPTTLEEIQRAYENLSDDDKKTFEQSISDRIHESIAAQEREHGQEDEQSAEAREHEALGEEHADGEGDTEELHEQDDSEKEKEEDAEDKGEDVIKSILARLDAIDARFEDKDKNDDEAAEKAAKVYGVGNGVFAAARKDEEKITPKEAAEIARKQKF